MPIKFVQDDDEEDASDDLNNQLMKVHDQLYGMWRQFTESFSQDDEVEPRQLAFDLVPFFSDITNVDTFTFDGSVTRGSTGSSSRQQNPNQAKCRLFLRDM